jgi:hypothetical protein
MRMRVRSGKFFSGARVGLGLGLVVVERRSVFVYFAFCGTCFLCGLLALPLSGAGLTFFAAAKKVSKESSFFRQQS